jgi:hypothetical protein
MLCYYAECGLLFIFMLNVIMLSVITPNVVMPNIVMALSVVLMNQAKLRFKLTKMFKPFQI